MRVGSGRSAPPPWAVWLFIALLAIGSAVYGFEQGGVLHAVVATALAYTIYGVAGKLRVMQR